MDGGSLDGRRIAAEPFLADVARQVLSGIAYLHRRHIVHRDIKPSNLLIDSARRVKIADFGVGRILNQTMDPCNSSVGTIAYMSPERINTDLKGGSYDGYAGDIWSFGLSILELYLPTWAGSPSGRTSASKGTGPRSWSLSATPIRPSHRPPPRPSSGDSLAAACRRTRPSGSPPRSCCSTPLSPARSRSPSLLLPRHDHRFGLGVEYGSHPSSALAAGSVDSNPAFQVYPWMDGTDV